MPTQDGPKKRKPDLGRMAKLLALLKSSGVQRYEEPDVKIEFAPAPVDLEGLKALVDVGDPDRPPSSDDRPMS